MMRSGLDCIGLPPGGREHSTAEVIGWSLFVSLLLSSAISEALNNILIVLLFIWWLWTRPAVRELRGAPLYLLIIVLFFTTPLVSLATSTVGEPTGRLADVTGAVKFALLLPPIYSISSRNGPPVDLVTACLTAGTLIASVEAFVSWHPSSGHSPILMALANVNESAIHMSVILAAAAAATWSAKLPICVLGYAGITTSLWLSLISDSLTALAVSACVLFLAAIASAFTVRRRAFLSVTACLAALSGAALATTGADVYWKRAAHEFTNQVYGDNVGEWRFEIFNTAAEVYDRNLWFGAGYKQFGKATSVEVIAQELHKEGRSYDAERSRFFHAGHGHSIWTNALIEGGLVGVGLLLSFFLATAFRICTNVSKLYRTGECDLELVQLAFISCAVWTMLLIGGIGDLTIRNEHGMVALLLLVWSLTRFEVRSARPQDEASTSVPRL